MNFKLAAPLFLFLFLMISPAFAYESTLINTSYAASAGTSVGSVRCTNLSGTGYCYIFANLGIERFELNLTTKSTCLYGYSAPAGITAIINSTTAWAGSPNSFLYNLSDMVGTCHGLDGPHNIYGGGDGIGYESYVYWPANTSNKATIRYHNNWTWAADGYWQYSNVMAMPNMSDNSTVYIRNDTSDYRIYKYVNGNLTESFPSFADIYGLPGETYSWDMLKENDGSTYAYFNAYGRFYKVNFTALENTTYSGCNFSEVVGTRCEGTNTYITTDGCTNTTGTCPSGSHCSQLTPQINVTTDLVENLTSCYIRTYFGTQVKCTNMCYRGSVLWSNCYDDGCKICPTTDTGVITVNGSTGYYTNTYYTNQSTVSVPSYTIACIDTSNGSAVAFINETGNSTTLNEILTRAGNNITDALNIEGACVNTTTTCYAAGTCDVVSCYSGPDNIGGFRAYMNTVTGSSLGGELISLILSGVVATFFFIKTGADNLNTFIIPMLLMLSAFTFVGLFSAWFMILMAAMVFIVGFYKMRS